MAFLYPWGNTQQLNLDWILQKIKELEAGSGGADLDEVANALISATYARQAYDRSDIVFYNGKLYRANQAIPAPGEVWTPAHWDEILLGDTVSNLVQYVAALSNDQIVNSSSVSGDHTSDALDTLKNAIDNIPLDSDSISNESNVTGTNVSDALDTLDGAISDEATTRGNADTAINNVISAITPLDTLPTNGSLKGITSGAVYTSLSIKTGTLIANDYYDPTFSHTYSVTSGVFLLTLIGYGPPGGATTAKGQYIITCGAGGNARVHPLTDDSKFTLTGNDDFTVTIATASARYTGVILTSMIN